VYWLEVSIALHEEESAEIVSEILRPFAQDSSIVMEQLGDAANLDPNAMEPGITVKIYVPGDEDTAELRHQITNSLVQLAPTDEPLTPTFKKLEESDWANAWKENYQPFRIGNHLWIQPSWLEAETHDPEDIILTLDPGMAFGTGTHETTQLCLMALEKYIRPGDRVLDVGTGSGILAIAAVKLGASEVMAIDTDRQAVKAVVENGEMNGVAANLAAYQGTLASAALKRQSWDLLLVNILAPVIIELFEQDNLIDYPSENGRLILSGIITEQIAEIDRVVASAGGQITEKMSMGDWVGLVVERID
jgi:ribosomal protein L11 methyltransferase